MNTADNNEGRPTIEQLEGLLNEGYALLGEMVSGLASAAMVAEMEGMIPPGGVEQLYRRIEQHSASLIELAHEHGHACAAQSMGDDDETVGLLANELLAELDAVLAEEARRYDDEYWDED